MKPYWKKENLELGFWGGTFDLKFKTFMYYYEELI